MVAYPVPLQSLLLLGMQLYVKGGGGGLDGR